jgi:hypothetical protein
MADGDLTDLGSLKAWLGVTDGSQDSLLSSLITAASTFVKSWLNRDIVATDYVERYRGNGRKTIVLANGPVVAVSQVAWVGVNLTDLGDPIAMTPGFYFDGRNLSLVNYCFPYRDMVQVSYTAGYIDIPADISQAVNEIIGEAFRRRDRIGQNSKTLGGQETISFSTADMNATAKAILNQYKAVAPVAVY